MCVCVFCKTNKSRERERDFKNDRLTSLYESIVQIYKYINIYISETKYIHIYYHDIQCGCVTQAPGKIQTLNVRKQIKRNNK